MWLADLPAPPGNAFHLGPVPIRAYALCIIAGIGFAVLIAERRFRARGGRRGLIADVATWAIPFGLVGARLYNIVSDPEEYFGPGRDWVNMFRVWHGGLGIWGAVALGALGAYIASRRYGIRFAALADVVAPGLAVAQAIGRWGNYFNQELFGGPSKLPWALYVSPAHRPPGDLAFATYQPTFFYECLWDLGVAAVVIWADRRFRLGRGRAFWLYVACYTVGRGWVEALRIDHANHFLGLRLNDWTSMLVFLIAVVAFVLRRGPREDSVLVSAQGEEAGGGGPAGDQPAAAGEPGAGAEPAAGGERAAVGEAATPGGSARSSPPDPAALG
jgi:prolipoprotein diacylglyceryl transferase